MPAVNKQDILKNQEAIDAFVDQSMTLPKLGTNLNSTSASKKMSPGQSTFRFSRNKVKINGTTIEQPNLTLAEQLKPMEEEHDRLTREKLRIIKSISPRNVRK